MNPRKKYVELLEVLRVANKFAFIDDRNETSEGLDQVRRALLALSPRLKNGPETVTCFAGLCDLGVSAWLRD